MAKFNVGDKVRCVDDTDCAYGIVYGEVYIISYAGEYVVELEGFPQDGGYFYPARFELVEEACVIAKPPTFDLRDTKINVKAYAEKNRITLEKSYEEIQEWLFERGYNWNRNTLATNVMSVHASYLYVRGEELLYGNDEHRFYVETTEKEITFSRQITLSPSYVEEELVEFDGKKYNKREFLFAIANVKEKTNE